MSKSGKPSSGGKLSGSEYPDLISTLIIVLISGAITIFIFLISTQFLGLETFAKVPDYLIGAYKGIWAAGGTGIGLSIIKALSRQPATRVNHFKWIGITSGCFIILITIFVIILNHTSAEPFDVSSYRAFHWDMDDEDLHGTTVFISNYLTSNKIVGTLKTEEEGIDDKGPYTLAGWQDTSTIIMAGAGSKSGGLGTIVLKKTQKLLPGREVQSYEGYIIDQKKQGADGQGELMKCPFVMIPNDKTIKLDIKKRNEFLRSVPYLEHNRKCENFEIHDTVQKN